MLSRPLTACFPFFSRSILPRFLRARCLSVSRTPSFSSDEPPSRMSYSAFLPFCYCHPFLNRGGALENFSLHGFLSKEYRDRLCWWGNPFRPRSCLSLPLPPLSLISLGSYAWRCWLASKTPMWVFFPPIRPVN